MSFAHWDELFLICTDLEEYNREKVIVKKIKVTRKPSAVGAGPTDIAPAIPVRVTRPVNLGEAVGYH